VRTLKQQQLELYRYKLVVKLPVHPIKTLNKSPSVKAAGLLVFIHKNTLHALISFQPNELRQVLKKIKQTLLEI
jgi:hypothetical protein